MGKVTIDLKDLDDLLCKYEVKDLEDLENRFKNVADLEVKLAESEKENKKLREVVDCVDKLKQFNADMNDYALVNKDVATEIYCEHQDKISFAVEQLELTRRRIDCLGYNENKCLNKKDCIEDCLEEINNQIKQLKEMK